MWRFDWSILLILYVNYKVIKSKRIIEAAERQGRPGGKDTASGHGFMICDTLLPI